MSDLIYNERLYQSLSISAGVTKNLHDLFEPYALAPSVTRSKLESYYDSLDPRSIIGTERDLLFFFLYDVKEYKEGRKISYLNCEFTERIYQGKFLGQLHGTKIHNRSDWADYEESSVNLGVIPVLNATPTGLEQVLAKIPEYREYLQPEKLIVIFNGTQEENDIKGFGAIFERYVDAGDFIIFKSLDGSIKKELSRVWLSKKDF